MEEWNQLISECNNCKKCDLWSSRTNVVIGRGNINAPMMLIGEGPGRQEDLQGVAFVGQAGKLLDLLLKAMMIDEDQYYIANIVKCRPPGNRKPSDQEAYTCLPFLRSQVMLIKPRIIVCLGNTAMRYVLKDKDSRITGVRGKWQDRKGYSIMPTFHPAALLRDKSKKVLMWEDFKKAKQRLDNL